MNAAVGVRMGMSAESSLESLSKLNPATATVVRGGKITAELPVSQIVPGDIIMLKTGDKVPADSRVMMVNGGRLGSDESALTGEPETVDKVASEIEATPGGRPPAIQLQCNMLFSGTLITAGSCAAMVTSTGENTEIGKISSSVQAAASEAPPTPLQAKLDKFASKLSLIVGSICLACFASNIPKFTDDVFDGSLLKGCLHYAKVSVALGVAAIPEGLPAVITLCLSLGTRRMARRNVIVRNLPSVETLGCTSVICSDKTGTLTSNKMTAVAIATLSESGDRMEVRSVSGEGYDPTSGSVEGTSSGECWSSQRSAFFDVAQVSSLCGDARILYNPKDQQFDRVGEPTEAALAVLAEKLGDKAKTQSESADYNAKIWRGKFQRAATLEFDRGRKSMGVLVRPSLPGGKVGGGAPNKLLVKGAPSSVISRCTHAKLKSGKVVRLNQRMRDEINEVSKELARRPLRTLAMATKTNLPKSILKYSGAPGDVSSNYLLGDREKFASIESGLTFVGLCGIKDPARPEVADSIATCGKAGIRVMMITGDAKDTAVAIARDVNIFKPEDVASGNIKAFEGREFFELPEAEQLTILKSDNIVFCRAEPKDKQKLVKMLQRLNEIPAMTGDGVNDAPALQQAAIGISMGITGTEVAKEAADMVLVDDNFATIVSAVEEGRCIYASMQAFICFLISCNVGEIAAIFIASIMGLPEPLTAMHLLWVNLVTDGPPATALSFNPPDPDVMDMTPREADEEIMTKWLLARYMLTGLYVGLATVGILVWHYIFEKGLAWRQLRNWTSCGSDWGADCGALFSRRGKMLPQTLALTTLVCMEMFKALSAVSVDNSLLVVPSWKNKFLLAGVAFPTLLHIFVVHSKQLGFGGIGEAFGMVALSKEQWIKVLQFSSPILLVDEVLKFMGRRINARKEREKLRKAMVLK